MIYLLEDDESIRNFIVYALNNMNLEARGFERPSEFWEAMRQELPRLVLLDIMLPEQDGIEILRLLREKQETAHLPIIMLTAKGTEYDKVLGLDSGADDYIAKPFGTMELVSRIKALLRRTENNGIRECYQLGGLYLEPARHLVRVNGREVTLTLKEFDLLCMLFRNRGVLRQEDHIQPVRAEAFQQFCLRSAEKRNRHRGVLLQRIGKAVRHQRVRQADSQGILPA